jgi:hypothetical protein
MAIVTIYSDAYLNVKVDSAASPRLKVVAKPLTAANSYPPSGDLPGWVRPLANLALEDTARPGVGLASYGQTVTIEVTYTQADRRAAGGKPVKFGYWDGSKWVKFANFIDYPDADPQKGGRGTVTFSSWLSDPPVAVGS